MHLLLKQFADIVKTEGARALYQYHLVAECAERVALDERCGVGEEVFLCHLDAGSLGHEVFAHADKFLHPTFHAEV